MFKPKKFEIASIQTKEATRQERQRALINWLKKPDSSDMVRRVRTSLAMGKTLDEARVNIGVKNDKVWNYLVMALGALTINKEKLYLEFSSRTQTRYEQVYSRYKKYKDTGDDDGADRMLLVLIKLDQALVDTAVKLQLLGLENDSTEGTGYSDIQVRKELERIMETIQNQVDAGKTTTEPLYIGPSGESERDVGSTTEETSVGETSPTVPT